MDWTDKEFREVVSGSFAILSHEISEDKWAGAARSNPDLTKTILNHEITLKLKKDYDKLTSLRNDVHHAGYLKDNKKYSNIYSSVYKIFDEVKKKLFN